MLSQFRDLTGFVGAIAGIFGLAQLVEVDAAAPKAVVTPSAVVVAADTPTAQLLPPLQVVANAADSSFVSVSPAMKPEDVPTILTGDTSCLLPDGTWITQPTTCGTPTSCSTGTTSTSCPGIFGGATTTPTNCAGGVNIPTACPGGGAGSSTVCAGGTQSPTACPGGVTVPTNCPGVTTPTACSDGSTAATNCAGNVVTATSCPGGATAPTACGNGVVAATNCSGGYVATNCPDGLWPTFCPVTGTTAPTVCPPAPNPANCRKVVIGIVEEEEATLCTNTSATSTASN